MNIDKALKFGAIATTALMAVMAVLCLLSGFAVAAPADLAAKYSCDENTPVSINYAMGAQTLQFDGKNWLLVLITDGYAERNGETIPTIQYEFANHGESLFFITGKGAQDAAALLLPNSDDLLYCEAVK